MDDVIIWIILGIIYLVVQGLAGKKKPKRKPGTASSPPPEAPQRDTPAAEVTLDDALLEIRRALGMETPPAPPPPPVKKETPPPPKPKLPKLQRYAPELAKTTRAPTWGDEFIPHEQHFADEEFEALTSGAEGFQDPHHDLSPLPPLPPPSGTKTPRSSRLLDTLKDPAAAREAFLLHEILGPPRAHRRR